MKKKVLFIFLIFLILCTSFIIAANESVSDKAYACLDKKVEAKKCSELTTEEKIFSLLSVQRCKTELVSEALNGECWPKSGCKIKTTAQAILALRSVNEDTVKAENWLLKQTVSPPDIDWLLQIDSDNETICTIQYDGSSYTTTIEENKEIKSNAGSCLRKEDDYWLRVTPTCFDKEFKISCDRSFSTSLLYKKESSETVYVPAIMNSASAEGTTTEKISAFCFKDGTSCNYEGSLWASLVLKYRGYPVSSYIPYLTTMMEENLEYLPESFLYYLTNSFRTELLLKQEESKFWAVSGDKFYDTAVALFPFSNDEPLEKANAKAWLTEVQGADGCWQGNVRNTGFILYSIWPKISPTSTPTAKDCEDEGNFCVPSSAACTNAGGSVLVDYSGCFNPGVCCTKDEIIGTCAQEGGDLCDPDEECLNGLEISSSDSTSSRVCCDEGICGIETQTECEKSGGTCRTSCSDGEEPSNKNCNSSDICCVTKGANFLWLVWVLLVLIALVTLGIIFRNKLREIFLRIKSKFGGGKPSTVSGGPRFPPSSSSILKPGLVPRRIIPQSQTPARRPVQGKSEFDEVLRKLKEIGK